MVAKTAGNFPILQVREDDPIIVHMVHDDTMVYIAIECTGKSLDELHAIMRGVQSTNSWMPNMLPPTRYHQASRSYLAVECFNKKPLIELAADWCFVRAQVCYSSSNNKWNSVLLYPTLDYQKVIWSLLRTVLAFVDTSIRPILDIKSMFLSKDNQVIFSRYELREPRHDRIFEAHEIIKVLNHVVTHQGKTSVTIKAEFAALYTWLVSSDSPFGPQPIKGKFPPLDNALKMVVFWSCHMRINYIQLLGDNVIRDNVAIFPIANNAFEHHWRKVIEMQRNPVLTQVLIHGDEHYLERMRAHKRNSTLKPPSFLRQCDISRFDSRNVHRSGVVRIRDSFYHASQMTASYMISGNKKITKEDLQYMYQYIYPSHMVKLAQVQEQIKFNPQDWMLGSLVHRLE